LIIGIRGNFLEYTFLGDYEKAPKIHTSVENELILIQKVCFFVRKLG